MAERRPIGATFDVERVARQRSRGSLAALAWVGVLGATIGVALLGRGQDSQSPLPSSVEVAGAASSDRVASLSPADLARLVPAPGDHALIVDPIELLEPAIGPITLTTPSLRVYGTVGSTVSRVDVGLEGSNDRVLEQVNVKLQRLDRELAPTGGASFRTLLPIPDPAPNATMWVFVAVYDSSGVALGFESRPFKVRFGAGPWAEGSP